MAHWKQLGKAFLAIAAAAVPPGASAQDAESIGIESVVPGKDLWVYEALAEKERHFCGSKAVAAGREIIRQAKLYMAYRASPKGLAGQIEQREWTQACCRASTSSTTTAATIKATASVRARLWGPIWSESKQAKRTAFYAGYQK